MANLTSTARWTIIAGSMTLTAILARVMEGDWFRHHLLEIGVVGGVAFFLTRSGQRPK